MFKKLFSVMLLAVGMFIGSQFVATSDAEAADVYVGQGKFCDKICDVYVISESINANKRDPKLPVYSVKIKFVDGNKLLDTVKYTFMRMQPVKNSFFWRVEVDFGAHNLKEGTFEEAALNYCKANS